MSFKLQDLTYAYGKAETVLENASFSLQEGQIGILLGPNGVGKTTLIKCLVGLLKPNAGSAIVEETNLFSVKEKERAKLVSYVPQNISFPSLSVYDAILLGRLPYFSMYPGKADREATEKIISQLSLEKIAFRNIDELSGGERQKVAIARALIQSSKFMIFDEPTSNLDIGNQLMILDLIQKIAKENNSIVLIAMHDINQALRIGDRFVLLQGKNVVSELGPSELTSQMLESLYGEPCQIEEIAGNRVVIFPKKQ